MVTRTYPHLDERRREPTARERFIAESNRRRWSPQREFGRHGEFTGSRREEVLPSPNMPGSYRGGDEGWGNYPAGEFSGITSPNLLSGKKSDAYGDTLRYKDLLDKWTGMEDTPLREDASTMFGDVSGMFESALPGAVIEEDLPDTEGHLPGWGFLEPRMMPDEPPYGAVDVTGEPVMRPERPRWDNWLGNLLRSIGGRNRGGLASLRYAR